MKYLGINLTKEVKDLYLENYRTLKKEIKEDTINGSIYGVHELEELTSLKYRLPKAVYRFNAVSIKLPMAYFTDLEQIV